jgi:hypothetical protein
MSVVRSVHDGTVLADQRRMSGAQELIGGRPMNRTSPTIDLFTLIGMMATIAGIFLCLFFLFTPTTFGAPAIDVSHDRSADLYISMRWLQPTLGQAIVEDALIRQRDNDASEAVMLEPGAGSVQWVIGRVVVELHRSRLVAALPGGRREDDQRIVRIARHAAVQLQENISLAKSDRGVTGQADVIF